MIRWLVLLSVVLLLGLSTGCGGDSGKGKHSDKDRPLPTEKGS